MISNPIERRSAIAPIMLLGLFVMLVLAVGTATSMPYNTDCMKNPFASGCRGISAKRSTGLIWSRANANEGDGKATRANFYDLIGLHQANLVRANQLSIVTDLLLDAMHRLANLVNEMQSTLAKQQQETPGDLPMQSLATKRAIVGKESQREEASRS